MWPNLPRLLTAVMLLFGAVLLRGQDPGPDPANPASNSQSSKPQFFSGTVTTLDHEHITVSRSLVGKPPETRTFVITPNTKVAKSVKAKARVTVRYEHEEEEGDVALEIQIRSGWRFPRTS
jgi:hypothetical protein